MAGSAGGRTAALAIFSSVFTPPKPIADIAHQNKREIYNLLMRVSADTVIKIAADPKHLGAWVGIPAMIAAMKA